MNVRFRTQRFLAPDNDPTPGAPSPAPAPELAPPAPEPAPPAPAPEPAPAPPAKWPDNWRELAIGEPLSDKATPEEKDARAKMEALVKRYNSPADVAKALRAAQVKISDGTLKTALPKNATPEQLAEWRKENGIPETPDKYDLGLPNGTVLGDADKAIADEWVKEVHGANASPEVVKAGMSAYLKVREQQIEKIVEADNAAKATGEDELRADWGADYRANTQGVSSLLNHAGEDVATAILQSRGPDGKLLANNTAVIKWLAGHARELGYVGSTVVPAGGDLGKSIDDELQGLKDLMSKDMDAWRKNAKGQARYIQLVEAKQRQESRK